MFFRDVRPQLGQIEFFNKLLDGFIPAEDDPRNFMGHMLAAVGLYVF